MAVVNSEQLLEQAEQLFAPSAAGAPRQVDLRRSISAAYYAVFHFVLSMAADQFVGATKRQSSRYVLVYRSVNHAALKKLCEKLTRPSVSDDILLHFPSGGLGPNLPFAASAVVELQEKRHLADYDPSQRFNVSDAKRAVETAASTIRRLKKLNTKRREAFLTLLCFSSR